MNSTIVETLALMCNKDNPQDKKMLLLAELVETKYDALGKAQGELRDSIALTNEKLDKLTQLLTKYESATHDCPVYKNKDSYEKLSFLIKNPKIYLLVLVGILSLVGGFFGANFAEIIKLLAHL